MVKLVVSSTDGVETMSAKCNGDVDVACTHTRTTAWICRPGAHCVSDDHFVFGSFYSVFIQLMEHFKMKGRQTKTMRPCFSVVPSPRTSAFWIRSSALMRTSTAVHLRGYIGHGSDEMGRWSHLTYTDKGTTRDTFIVAYMQCQRCTHYIENRSGSTRVGLFDQKEKRLD